MTRPSILHQALSGQHRLARRLILYTVLFSGVIALVISALQVAIEYQRDVDDIEQRFDVIEKSYLPSIVESAWLLDREQLATLLAGIERLPDFDYAEVRFRDGVLAASGTRANVMDLERRWTLSRPYRGSDVGVGELTVQASLAGPRGRILDRLTFIVLANAFKTLLVAAFMFLLVWWLMTRHVEQVAAHVERTDPTVPVPALRLDRAPVDPPDELDRLAQALNTMAEQVRASEAALKELNEQLESRVQERTGQLQAANKELETFTYSVSHDLKAPLRGIDGYSRLLLEAYSDKLDDEGRQFLHNVRQATQQMNQLLNDLLAYSRLERQDAHLGQVDLRSLMQTLLAGHAEEFKARGVALSVALPCPLVSADREGLTMALRNLLENALKFTRDTPGPAIEIGGRDAGDSCILWVRDNGVGFDVKHHERIFAIFQRLHRPEDYPGTGVGLAIVRKAMERMRGRAWAESEPGKGATFYLEIPK